MNVMITGASRGIGFEIVKYFAQKNHNQVFALSRNKSALGRLATECAGLNKTSVVHPMVTDLDQFLTDPASLIKRLPGKGFRLDILINNAGLLINKPFDETTLDEAMNMFRVNCFAPALLINKLKPFMGKNGKTHIVNISSMGGFQGSKKFSGLTWYSASKAALACLTECLDEEINSKDIIFNCLALGAVQTEMLEEAFPGYAAPLSSVQMAEFIGHFALTAHHFMRGKVIPVSLTNP